MGEQTGGHRDLQVSDSGLKKLAEDLHDMQVHLTKQVERMDTVVDHIEAGWHGPAAKTYRKFHRAAAEDSVRIREVMAFLEQAVQMSRGGFSEVELDTLEKFRRIQVAADITSEVDRLSTPSPAAEQSAPPRSSLDSM
ncbi:WXG100 family type VII secretion target [Streptomyces sp. NPDC058067]|uniref:WXG100 family type VII secretion target n=1 Tax=Streptomyces sp. NPDC058067 TaxID=3346324 RepID=UPI0036E22F84